MKRPVALAVVALAFVLNAGSTVAYAQATLSIPFKFDAGGKTLPAGNYSVAREGTGSITLRPESKGAVVSIAVVKKLAQPTPPIEQPQLVFDMVGNFEPSYTEYVTDYVLAEVWLPGQDGLLVLATKRSEQHETVKGQRDKR